MAFKRYDGYVMHIPQQFIDSHLPVCPFCGTDHPHWLLDSKMEISFAGGRTLYQCEVCRGTLSSTAMDAAAENGRQFGANVAAAAMNAAEKGMKKQEVGVTYMRVESLGIVCQDASLLKREEPITFFQELAARMPQAPSPVPPTSPATPPAPNFTAASAAPVSPTAAPQQPVYQAQGKKKTFMDLLPSMILCGVAALIFTIQLFRGGEHFLVIMSTLAEIGACVMLVLYALLQYAEGRTHLFACIGLAALAGAYLPISFVCFTSAITLFSYSFGWGMYEILLMTLYGGAGALFLFSAISSFMGRSNKKFCLIACIAAAGVVTLTFFLSLILGNSHNFFFDTAACALPVAYLLLTFNLPDALRAKL
ncbi:MAG: hypothetical protein IJU16_03340 [Clostridia bacterium]|nr:hypothetical protein [Clostridia bacterium]